MQEMSQKCKILVFFYVDHFKHVDQEPERIKLRSPLRAKLEKSKIKILNWDVENTILFFSHNLELAFCLNVSNLTVFLSVIGSYYGRAKQVLSIENK
jgi:hypothetical protein